MCVRKGKPWPWSQWLVLSCIGFVSRGFESVRIRSRIDLHLRSQVLRNTNHEKKQLQVLCYDVVQLSDVFLFVLSQNHGAAVIQPSGKLITDWTKWFSGWEMHLQWSSSEADSSWSLKLVCCLWYLDKSGFPFQLLSFKFAIHNAPGHWKIMKDSFASVIRLSTF